MTKKVKDCQCRTQVLFYQILILDWFVQKTEKPGQFGCIARKMLHGSFDVTEKLISIRIESEDKLTSLRSVHKLEKKKKLKLEHQSAFIAIIGYDKSIDLGMPVVTKPQKLIDRNILSSKRHHISSLNYSHLFGECESKCVCHIWLVLKLDSFSWIVLRDVESVLRNMLSVWRAFSLILFSCRRRSCKPVSSVILICQIFFPTKFVFTVIL